MSEHEILVPMLEGPTLNLLLDSGKVHNPLYLNSGSETLRYIHSSLEWPFELKSHLNGTQIIYRKEGAESEENIREVIREVLAPLNEKDIPYIWSYRDNGSSIEIEKTKHCY